MAGTSRSPIVGILGAGNFARVTLSGALKKAQANVGPSRTRRDYRLNSWQPRSVRGSQLPTTGRSWKTAVDAVIIAVGHHLHADLSVEALEAGKHVLLEKPLGLSVEDVVRVTEAVRRHPGQHFMVGFNRRFSPHISRIAEAVRSRVQPLTMNYVINAGAIPPDHWVHDPSRGGGRIIGEACHFIDLMVFLSGSLVDTVAAFQVGEGPAIREDKMSIILRFADGSVGTVNYFANGSKSYPKETLEVFSDGRVIRTENFRKTRAYGFKGFRTVSTFRQEKGHAAEVAAFLERIRDGGTPLIPLEQIVNVTLASFAAVTSAREMRTVRISEEYPDLTPQ